MSKRHDIFNENFTILFLNAGKTGIVLGFELKLLSIIIHEVNYFH